MSFFLGSGDEALALLGHLIQLLFAHGAAQEIGFPEGIARQAVRDLHYLLLVDDDAVGLLQEQFQFGKVVHHLLAAVLAVDEIVDHAALDGARPVERV